MASATARRPTVYRRGPAARLRDLTGSVRVRTTLAAVSVLALSLFLAAIALTGFVERSLRSHERTAARIRAEAIARELTTVPDAAPALDGDPDEEFVQVLDVAGDVVLSSSNLEGAPPLVAVGPGQEAIIDEVPFEDSAFVAVGAAAVADDEGGRLVVIVGRSLERIAEARGALQLTALVVMPLLLAVFAMVTWRVVGRALAPVDAIREEVDAISTSELDRRVPDPPGRDEVARLAATMNRMLERLEQGQLRQRRFVSDASHELRSPVTTIRQHAELALSHPDRTSLDELAEVVLEEDVRIQALVEDLLLLARIDEGTMELRRQVVDVDDLLFAEAQRLRNAPAELRIDVSNVSAARVTGDRDKLERMIRNLADNASRHASSTVRLAARAEDMQVVVEVDDDGPGVPAELRSLIFERFARLDESRDRTGGGTGLGLAIVAEIAGAHGGSASVGDAPLGGARFEVRLPRDSSDT